MILFDSFMFLFISSALTKIHMEIRRVLIIFHNKFIAKSHKLLYVLVFVVLRLPLVGQQMKTADANSIISY